MTTQLQLPSVAAPEGDPASDRGVLSAPVSYADAARRIWRITGKGDELTGRAYVATKIGLVVSAAVLTILAIPVITGWYVVVGLLVVPRRLRHRGSAAGGRAGTR